MLEEVYLEKFYEEAVVVPRNTVRNEANNPIYQTLKLIPRNPTSLVCSETRNPKHLVIIFYPSKTRTPDAVRLRDVLYSPSHYQLGRQGAQGPS